MIIKIESLLNSNSVFGSNLVPTELFSTSECFTYVLTFLHKSFFHESYNPIQPFLFKLIIFNQKNIFSK